MPTYQFRDKETGEISEIYMSINDLDKYKDDNPKLEQYHDSFPGVVSTAGIKNPVPDGFRDVLKSIKKANIHSDINTH
jgi:hypothetical protein|tara:strand:- start:5644 stop:5877 length:234 start_codon:yes stop_codon:yes gene_type:complete